MTVIAGVDFPASVKGFMSWYRASGLARTVISHGEAGHELPCDDRAGRR
jgi:hypothetical protein